MKINALRKQLNDFYNDGDYIGALKIANKILDTYKKNYDDYEYCVDAFNLAYIQQKISKHIIAIRTLKKAIQVITKKESLILESKALEKIELIVDLENALGISYAKSEAQHSLSIACFEKAIGLVKNFLPNDDEKLAMLSHNIGCAYYNIEQYEDAIHYHLDELSYRKEKNIDLVDTLNFLGYSYRNTGNYDIAINYFNQALEILKGLFGMNSQEYLANIYHLSKVYFENGNYDLSKQNYEKSCHIIEQRLGDKHPYLAESLARLAEVSLVLKDFDNALKIQQKALNVVLETVGDGHIYYATSLKRLGDIYYMTGNFDKAVTYYEDEMAIKKDILGDYNEEYIHSILNLINVYIKINKLEEQRELENYILKSVDFDLSKKAYTKALLILNKIYLDNEMIDESYKIYEHYKNVSAKSFDEMLADSYNTKEDILNKEADLLNILKNDNKMLEDLEDEQDAILDGLNDLFDSIKNEINEFEQKFGEDEENN